MSGIAKAIFGDKGAERQQKEAAATAAAEAEKSRQLQAVANDRQLAAVNTSEAEASVSRKAPRGRRLFESDTTAGGVATTLGG